MTIHLTSSVARNIAEAAWGRGDTVAQRTTRRGTYYLTCKNGSGFVIDDAALTDEERRIFSLHAAPHPAWIVPRDFGAPVYHHELKQRQRGYDDPAAGAPTSFWLMGGNFLWTLPVLFADIGLHGATADERFRLRMRASNVYGEAQGSSQAA